VLWEIGDGVEVRQLRARLGLDSGYLSRLLRSLEESGMARLSASPSDHRVRTVALTARGARERRRLDERNDELARLLVEPLSEAQRSRLVAAMGEVERLLTAGLVEIDEIGASHPDATYCLGEYFAELSERFESGFDAKLSTAPTVEQFQRPHGLFLIARLRGEPIGCGALKLPVGNPPEIKRMWVAREARGLGVGRRLLAEIERRAAAEGGKTIRLETNKALTEAIGLYRAQGYREVAAFNDEHYAHHWFEKRL
jgi:DNA-binding MarR family transcriptional regulator/ribosomal protein S18 acetylase RimI-like enzyme